MMSRWMHAALALATPAVVSAQRPDAATLARRVDAFVTKAFAVGATPGLGVGVVLDDRMIYQKGLGFADQTRRIPADDSTFWYLASTSKSYTGFGIALLEAAGAVDLSAPIAQVLPRARWHPDARPDELTLAHFLAHTHGLQMGAVVMSAAFTGAIPEARWPELLVYSEPRANRDLTYSNLGYNVAAMVIDTRRPEGWKRFLDEQVYAPAGLRNTRTSFAGVAPDRIARPHELEPDGSFRSLPMAKRDVTMNAAGGHIATIADLARWTLVHMNDGVLEGRQVFPASVVRRSHEGLGTHDRMFAGFHRTGWGFGWDLGDYQGEPMVSRFGGYASYRSHLSFLPRRRVGVVAQVNGTPGSVLTDIIAAYVYDLEAGRATADSAGDARLRQLASAVARARAQAETERATRAARQRPLGRPLADYAGAYEHDGYGTITWRVDGTSLHASWGVLESVAEVFDSASHRLRVELLPDGSPVKFLFEGPGPARAIEAFGITFTRRR